MKKKIIIGIMSVVTLIAAFSGFYVISCRATRTDDLLTYLEIKGYSASEIKTVTVKYSFTNLILGYAEWSGYVEFEDEVGIIYHYNFGDGISQGSFSGDSEVYGNLEKEELL